MAEKRCDMKGCLNSTANKPELIFITLPADRRGHSKWLTKTFGDSEVKNPKCQTVCEAHIDPMFLRIIQRRQLTVTPDCALPSKNENKPGPSNPGPSGATYPGSVETKPSDTGKRAPNKKTVTPLSASSAQVPKDSVFVAVSGIFPMKEPSEPEFTAINNKRSHSTKMADERPKKRARIDASTKRETSVDELTTKADISQTLTSELIIKTDPDSYEAVLLPSVYEDIEVRQEAPEAGDIRESITIVNESLDYRFDSIDATDSTRSPEQEKSNCFGVSIKVEENAELISEIENHNELKTTFNSEEETPESVSVSQIINDILVNKLISPTEKNILDSYKLDIQLLQDNSNTTSNTKLKSFAIALYIYSHRAYEYVRNKYTTCLPPVSVLRDWLVQSKGKAGFTRETLEAINAKTTLSQQKNESRKVYVCLSLKDVKMVSRRYGRRNHPDNIKNPLEYVTSAAYSALVMSAVALNANWKIPIGYFWTNVVKGSERANLVHIAISILETVGVIPVALTFEYNKDNLEMCNHLSCCIEKVDLKTSFLSESGRQIYIFPDPRGVLEVIYKCFSYTDSYVDESLQVVSLTQIPMLLQLSHLQPTTPQHSLRKAIAAELCKRDIFSYFAPAAGILTFLKNIHIVLDVVSSRKGGLKLKKPIPKAANKTANPSVEALQEAGKYFKSLNLNGSMPINVMLPIWATEKGIGILGLCAIIDSTLMLICKYSDEFSIEFGKFVGNPFVFLANLTPPVHFRKRPSATYFQKKYKLMLQQVATFKLSLAIENISLLTCKYAYERINQTTYIPNINNSTLIESDLLKLLRCQLGEYEDTFMGYIARFVTYSLASQLQCDVCISAIRAKPDKEMLPLGFSRKRCQFLKKSEEPSKDVLDICKTAEAVYKVAANQCGTMIPKINEFSLVTKVMEKYVYMPLFPGLKQHQFDTDIMNNHVVDLAKAVAEMYLETRIKNWKSNMWSK